MGASLPGNTFPRERGGGGNRVGYGTCGESGVAEGSRTPYLRSHNPVLYLVSYGHHRQVRDVRVGDMRDGMRAGDVRSDQPTVASIVGRGREIRTPDFLLPKQARYQAALYPEALPQSQASENNLARCRPGTRFHGSRILLSDPGEVNAKRRIIPRFATAPSLSPRDARAFPPGCPQGRRRPR